MAKAMSGMFFSGNPNQIPYVFPACNRFWSDKQFNPPPQTPLSGRSKHTIGQAVKWSEYFDGPDLKSKTRITGWIEQRV
jgi:hypothetical protein